MEKVKYMYGVGRPTIHYKLVIMPLVLAEQGSPGKTYHRAKRATSVVIGLCDEGCLIIRENSLCLKALTLVGLT